MFQSLKSESVVYFRYFCNNGIPVSEEIFFPMDITDTFFPENSL